MYLAGLRVLGTVSQQPQSAATDASYEGRPDKASKCFRQPSPLEEVLSWLLSLTWLL